MVNSRIKMIDEKLREEAKASSKVIAAIEDSWKVYVRKIKDNTLKLPFTGEYNAMINNKNVYVEGYCGDLVIDKMYCQKKMYWLKTPIKQEKFRVYGVYNNRGKFEHFSSVPCVGFHYMGLDELGGHICMGNIPYSNPTTLNKLREIAEDIVKGFRLINTGSIGHAVLPEQYERLKKLILEQNIVSLIEEKLIEEIL